MRCHYDVLGISLTATSEEIKKAYRKSALKWHPDKHSDTDKKTQEEANQKFLVISDAYETLIEPNDRAWYDSHREILMNGGNPGEPGEANYMFNIFPFFSPTCFKGYADNAKGFYSVYRDMFATLAEEDKQFYEEVTLVPEFGDSRSSYEEVVAPFYSFWLGYCTPRSFVWCEKHDTREAGERYVRRVMEKENKKLMDKAKKERNEEIRKLVETVRKRDKRVMEYKRLLEEKNVAAQKIAQEKRDAHRLKKLEESKGYVEPAWSSLGSKLARVHLIDDRLHKYEEESYDSDDEFDEALFCVACDKSFKTDKAIKNHEKSKKHLQSIELLKEHMMNEDEQMDSEKNSDQSVVDSINADEIEELEEEEGEEVEFTKPNPKLSKKDKKKRKDKQLLLQKLENDSESETEILETEMTKNSETSDKIEVDLNDDKETHEIEPEATTSTKVPKKRKPKKTCISAPKVPEVIDDLDSEIPAEPCLKCVVCEVEFETRNKLFEHIEKEGHASAAATDQLSYNQIKKNRILIAKANKAAKK